jgi:hypothetical protein
MTAHVRLAKTGLQAAARLCHLLERLDSRWNAKVKVAIDAAGGSSAGWDGFITYARSVANLREIEDK